MITDRQDNPGRQSQVGSDSAAGTTGNVADASPEASFDRLLKQLEGEERPPADREALAATLEPPPPQDAPGEFTRIFTQLPTPRSEPPAILAKKALVPGAPAAPAKEGEFTQFFQSLTPVPRLETPVPPATLPRQQAQLPALALQPESASTIVATAPPVLAPAATAVPVSQTFAPVELPALALGDQAIAAPAKKDSAVGGFTELLRSLESSQPTGADFTTSASASQSAFSPKAATREDARAFSPVASSPLPPFSARAADNASAQQSFAPASSQPQPAVARPGEFTQLMRSLQTPVSKQEAEPSNPSAQVPFFGDTPASSGGPSEYTRIIQGSAARSAQVPVATFAPAPQSSGAAVGLPIAVPQIPKPPAPQAAEAKTKLQAMLPWLLAANVALLLLLLVLAVMFLRHKH